MSLTTDDWICHVDNDEHEPGTLTEWALRVEKTLEDVHELVQEGYLTSEQGLAIIEIDAGLRPRSRESVEIGKLIHAGDIDALIALVQS